VFTHIDGSAAYCDHVVRFGVVESVNATIKGVLRRARGMRDEPLLVLNLNGRPPGRFAMPAIARPSFTQN